MHGSERREQIIRQIQESKAPVSGTKLASFYNVSRQVPFTFASVILKNL